MNRGVPTTSLKSYLLFVLDGISLEGGIALALSFACVMGCAQAITISIASSVSNSLKD